ncbi:META domain-containing protein [Sinorhizobium americanum]|uniref:Heat shock protein HslJ n=1 Tax=Sinorhizobium americanum TaxID=194963 RepID=A0A4V2RFC0_9HYPH|nr:META domain-containing protein [Sinorhizobium americanum]TCN32040.1 heat shock protein HslJ [Sinorhizobium americanum]
MLNALTAASCACVLIELTSLRSVGAENVPQELIGSWRAEAVKSGEAVDDPEMVLEIREDGTYGGTGGCNFFTGVFSLSEGTIIFGPTEATHIICAPAVMEQEQKLFDMLKDALAWKVDAATLALTGPDGASGMRLVPVQAPSSGGKP